MSRNGNDQVDPDVDVAVIGGGAAGLTAAVTLGRARRSTVVIDSGAPRNAPSAGVHMFLTRDGISPADLTGIGRQEVESYGGRFIDGTAVTASRSGENFAVTIDDGRAITARRLMVTTGLTDELPDIPGVRELWGRDVHHCPYCHGWELDGRAVGVIGSGPRAVHQALMFRQWVSDLVLFLHSAPDLTAEEEEQLAARGIRVVIGIRAVTGISAMIGTVAIVSRAGVGSTTSIASTAGIMTGTRTGIGIGRTRRVPVRRASRWLLPRGWWPGPGC